MRPRGRSPPRRADAKRNRDAILATARAAFAKGEGEISMAEIARRAGVGMATLYRNFPGRRELLEALCADEVDAICDAAGTVEGAPGEALTTWLQRFLAYFVSKRPISAELLQHSDPSDPVFDSNRDRVLAAGSPLLTAAQQAHEIRDDLTLEQILDMVIAIAKIPAEPDYLGPISRPRLTASAPGRREAVEQGEDRVEAYWRARRCCRVVVGQRFCNADMWDATGIARAAAAGAAAIASTLTVCGGAAGARLPVVYNLPAAIVASTAQSGGSPPGANDATCQPSAAHPRPVLLAHGTIASQTTSWNAISPLLKNEGYCVYSFTYGGSFLGQIDGLGPIADSAAELKAEVDAVLAQTGASEVDVVGWSQGGLMPRYYLKNVGGAAKVNALVGLAPPNHGTTLSGLAALTDLVPGPAALLGICDACRDMHPDSPFMTALNADGDTVPGVAYTVIASRYDQLVTPYTSAFVSGPNVTNITLQNQCVLDLGDHTSMPYDHIAARDVLNALDPANAQRPVCSPVVPGVGG